MTERYDVIVVGLGGAGSAAAYHLAARGQRVLGLERFTPAHANGSSHGQTRIIRQAYFEDPAYVPLLQRAYELWEALERAADTSILTLTGGLMIGRPESGPVAGSLRSAQEWDLPHELLDAADLRRRFPQFNPSPETVALYETRAGFVRPEQAILSHLRLAAAHGAQLRFEEPLERWQPLPGGGVQVTTARGTYQADRLVLAPGAWAPELMADLGLPLRVERLILTWFEPSGDPALFAPDRFPIFIWELDDGSGLQLYGFPQLPDITPRGVKASFFRLPADPATTPQTIDRTVYPHEIEAVRAALARSIPLAAGRFVDAVTCMYTTTPDHNFVIGAHPANPDVIVASPCSGHGYKFMSVIGEILADLAADGTTRHPLGLFSPTRFAADAR